MTKPNPIRICVACERSFRKAYRHETYCSIQCLLWSRIAKGKPDECWPWKGACNDKGYGQFRRNGEAFYAHRAVCELSHGAPGPDDQTMHSCDNPPCCNPGHLSFGTAQDNQTASHQKGRRQHIKHQRGEARHNAKMNEARIKAIRRDLSAGMSTYAAGRKYGISQPTVVQIKNRITWKHVE